MSANHFKLIECPRDAMQGIKHVIPTALKIEYLNTLLQVGFDTLDFGSFVSPKAIPQMADTKLVLDHLDLGATATQLLAIVANQRGVLEAVQHPQITYLGFPFSISETFQQRNTNSSRKQSLETVEEMLSICDRYEKQAVVYLSMGFGNPYGDEWNEDIVMHWADLLIQKGVRILSVADTVGTSTPEQIQELLPRLIEQFAQIEIGLHLHATPADRFQKIEAAYQSGVKRIDTALRGFGGCPMADDHLTGNIATEDVISILESKGQILNLNMNHWREAISISQRIFL